MPHPQPAVPARTNAPRLRSTVLALVSVMLACFVPAPTLALRVATPVAPEPAVIADAPTASELDWMWLKQEGTAEQDGAGIPAADGNLYFLGATGIRKIGIHGAELWSKPFTVAPTGQTFPARMAVTTSAIYVSGFVRGGNISNPSTAPAGGDDAFIRKYDLAGNELWTRQFGTAANETVSGVAVDPSGVYVVGMTMGAFPGETLQGASDLFVSKFDHGGTLAWHSQFGTAGIDQSHGGLAVRNPTGGATATNGDGIYVAVQATVATASWDSGIQALDLNGTPTWSDQFDSHTFEYAAHIAVDHTGVYLVGITGGTVPQELDDGINTHESYVIKYGFNGARVNTLQFGAVNSSSGQQAAVYPYFVETDGTGVYVAGSVLSGGAIAGQTSAGANDAFIRKYDTDLNPGGTRQFGTAGNDGIQGLAIDHTGVYVTGDTSGSFPGYTNADDPADPRVTTDAFFAKLSIVPAPPREVVEQRAAPTTPLDESQDAVKAAEYQGDPVNVLFGNFTHQHTDLATGGLGLAWTRTYNSATPRSGLVGWGWSIAWDLRIGTDPDGFTTLTRGDGRVDRYRRLSATTFEAPLGSVDRLTRASAAGNYILLTRDEISYVFDPSGRLTSATDPDGNVITLSYTAGKWTGISDAAGRAWTIAYASAPNADRIASVRDNSGRTVSYAYDGAGNLSTVTDASGGVTAYQYDANHRLTRITDPRGNLFVSHVYNADGRVVTQNDAAGTHTFEYLPHHTLYTDPLGKTTTTHYDNSHRVTKIVDALGGATTMTYDANGLLKTRTDALGNTTSYTYDARGNVLSITDALSNVTTMTYDARDNLTRHTDALGNATAYAYNASDHLTRVTDALGNQTNYTYTSLGQLKTVTDELGGVTTYTYDTSGNVTRVTDALGNATTSTYDDAGRAIRVTDPLNHTTQTQYDVLGQVTKITAPDGGVTLYQYDRAGNRTSVTDPRGNKTLFGYNSANRLTRVTNPLGQATTYAYDAIGRRTAVTLPNGRTTRSTYDALGRRTAETTALGFVTRYEYDAVGNVTKRTEPGAVATRFSYDALGRVKSVTDALGGVTTLVYDAAGNVKKVTDPLGRETSYAYDERNRRTRETNPLGRTYDTAYDDLGRISSTTNGAGQRTSYAYDAVGRPTSIASGALLTQLAYDAAGNRTTAKHGPVTALVTTAYGYDVAGRLTSVASPQGTVSYLYDVAGNRTRMTQPGQVTNYTYDSLNRLASVKRGTAAVVSYVYDSAGRLRRQTFANGVISTMGYDADGRLKSLVTKKGLTTRLSVTYTLDARGNRTKETSTGFAGTYSYDALGRLTSATASVGTAGGATAAISYTYAFTYDKAGNRLRQTVNGVVTNYTYNAGNQLLTAGPRSFAYDLAGRVTNDGLASYTYDDFGRLKQSVRGTTTTTYGYDGEGNRISEATSTKLSAFLLDAAAANPVRIAATSSGATERFLYGLGRAGQVTAGGSVRYEHADGLGSVRLLTTATGAVAGRQNYEPFGARLNGSGMFGFTGEAYSDNGALLHLRAREYDPSVGRFLSTDPHAADPTQPHTLNRYQYVGNSPLNATDPSGRWSTGDAEYRQAMDALDSSAAGCFAGSDSECEYLAWISDVVSRYYDLIDLEAAGYTTDYATGLDYLGATFDVGASDSGAYDYAGGAAAWDSSFEPALTTADLIGPDGGSLLGSDGATLLGADGATLLGSDGATLLGSDGATLLGSDGATLLGADGATLIGNDGTTLIGNDGTTLIGNDGTTFAPRFSLYSAPASGPESSSNKSSAGGPGF